MADKKKLEEVVVEAAPATEPVLYPPAQETVVDVPPLAAPTIDKKEPEAAPVQIVSFDRWFATTQRPPHHKAGMKAFANTAGKKPVEQWNLIFQSY